MSLPHHYNRYILKMKINDTHTKSLYKNHKSAYEDDAGIDLFVPKQYIVPARAISFTIPLNIQCELVDAKYYKSISYYIYARSSISKTPLRLSKIGIIDAGYRGELDLIVDNISEYDYIIKEGQRITQICTPSLKPISLQIVDELSLGSRGSNGLGSSGQFALRN